MFRPKKSLGQNFLIDKNIINKIVSLTKIKKKNIVEIGPGTGNLTKEIIKQEPNSLILIEKDKFLSKDLNNNFKNKKTKVFNKDILNFNLEKIIKKNSIIFGNLPYNISSQILIQVHMEEFLS
jgi:16S rRNA (adenine1518-N6/adenine1519-N6)-dimethyltransferase